MSTLLAEPRPLPAPAEAPRETYLNVAHGLMSWLLTKDHKRIALLYLITVTVMFFIGGVAITLVGLHLFDPGSGVVGGGTYKKLFPLHGGVLGFFFFVP